MLSAADIQFEPSAGSKAFVLSGSLFMLTAGDSSLQAELATGILREVAARIEKDPNNWWFVSEVADLYVAHYNRIRNKRAENSVLTPLGLTLNTFQSNHKSMSDRLVNELTRELLNFVRCRVSPLFLLGSIHKARISMLFMRMNPIATTV
jgi:hypothetical protein